MSCDLLENSYLCGISNNCVSVKVLIKFVVICLKIRTFVVSATTVDKVLPKAPGCDLLENSYLCGISNNRYTNNLLRKRVVICLKIRTFVVSATTSISQGLQGVSCDLLENSYLCGISNNRMLGKHHVLEVVICLKIRTFVVSATTADELAEIIHAL